MKDNNERISSTAIAQISNIKVIPEDVASMVYQSIYDASKSGSAYIREAAAYALRKMYKSIKNNYWKRILINSLKELKKDDSRGVRNQAMLKENNS